MKAAKLFLLTLILAVAAVAQEHPVVIQTGTLLDGRGHALHDMQIVVQDGKIVRVEKASGKADYNLRAMTVIPAGSTFTITSPGTSARTARQKIKTKLRHKALWRKRPMRGAR